MAFSPSGHRLVLSDLQTGEWHSFPDSLPTGRSWSGDERYPWTVSTGRPRVLRIIDTQTMQVVRFGPAELRRQIPSAPYTRHDKGPIYFCTHSPGVGLSRATFGRRT